ncbi:hypothetical protein [Tannockella kyphosi]|uniref:hypothetical protein n=1 Tax=Tannockella kyphosi TaxID=2899121 RepID=UPI002010E941|nr:hypothetical protein [Tannockella kyphosi]
MEKINDNEVKLTKVNVEVSKEYQKYLPSLVKAKLEVHYHGDVTPSISCVVSVGQEDSIALFEIKLEYEVPVMSLSRQGEYIDQIGDIIKPRIEDLINYIIIETGHTLCENN